MAALARVACSSGWLTPARLRWLAPIAMIAAVISLVLLWRHPLMSVYLHLLLQIFRG